MLSDSARAALIDGETMKTDRVAFDTQLIVDALSKAAHLHLMSKSDYVRSTLAARMKDDGIEIAGAA